jgi:hypothetical protein
MPTVQEQTEAPGSSEAEKERVAGAPKLVDGA